MFTEEDGQRAVWLHGTAKDSTVDVLKSKGLNYDQSSNTMFYSVNSSFIDDGTFPIQANGDVKFGIEESDIATKPLHLKLTTFDIATAVDTQKYVFVKEGTEYTTSSYDKKDVKIDDIVTMTLSLNNVKQLVSGEFQVEFMKDLFKFENVKLNNAANEYAKEKGLEVSLQEPVVKEGTFNNTVKVGASMKGNAFSGMDGDMPFLDVTFKLVSDAYFDVATKFDVKQASYMKAGQTAATAIPYFSTESFNIIPTYSRVQGNIGPEAFLIGPENGQFLRKADYTKIGAQVYAMSPKGKKYKGTIDDKGFYTIHGIPASTEAYTVVIDVPGHLKAMKKFIPGYSVNGEMRGQHIRVGAKSLAGDVNGDRLIDIRDMQSVVDVYGKKDASIVPQDINQDGVVDETDVRFIEKNFLQKEVGVPEVVKPKETIGKKGLADFLRQIGLEPKK